MKTYTEEELRNAIKRGRLEGEINSLESLPITGIIGANGIRTDCVLASEVYSRINICKTILALQARKEN
jgi:hypothetical protein